jgi:hypothetical protein
MQPTTEITGQRYEFSHITNLKQLEEEIQSLKEELKKQGDDIEIRIRKLPSHVVKSTTETLLPSFLNSLISSGTWKLLLSGATLFANPFARGFSFKKNIVRSAKRLGLITLVKTAYSIWSNRRASKNSESAPQQPGIRKRAVSMLNTKKPKKN